MHRPIVRAAMKADGLEYVGEFARVDDEEYGEYVYRDGDLVVQFSLGEDDGDIQEFGIDKYGDQLKWQFLQYCCIDDDSESLDGEVFYDKAEIDTFIDIGKKLEQTAFVNFAENAKAHWGLTQ